MHRLTILMALLALTALPGMARAAAIDAKLTGFQEVPSVVTVARGDFKGRTSRDETSIEYVLEYEGLQGAVLQAHIHVAQKGVNGSIVIWLCGTASNPGPAGTQTCPTSPGTITGTITSADVIAASQSSQQIFAGELADVITAIRNGVAYVNVHTDLSSGGEIRGQIRGRNRN